MRVAVALIIFAVLATLVALRVAGRRRQASTQPGVSGRAQVAPPATRTS